MYLFNGCYQTPKSRKVSAIKNVFLDILRSRMYLGMFNFHMNLTTLKFKDKYIYSNFILKVGDIWILDLKDMEVIL